MSCTVISTLVNYDPPAITTRCGEIYCCESLNNFVVQCDTCSQQFNLLSCTLFIKHIKECYQNLSDPNITNQNDLTTNNIDNGETTVDHIDPLKTLKLEIVREKDQLHDFEEQPVDFEYLSDYMDEDELPIEKIIKRKKIEGIIAEYKNHPILRDPAMARLSTDSEKEEHYRQIMESINTKFKTNLTYNELYQQILTLRQEYKTVLKRKLRFENCFTNGSAEFNPKLWYLEKLSFIQGLNDDIQVELPSMDETNSIVITKQEPFDSESSDSGGQAVQTFRKPEGDTYNALNNPPIISDLIAQYKQYSFLWDHTASLYNNQHARKDAYRKIAAYISKKFNEHITERGVKQQLIRLRSCYRRVQRRENNTGSRKRLWYFNDLSFIDKKATEEENIVIPIEGDANVPKILDYKEDSIVEYKVCEREDVDEKAETSGEYRDSDFIFGLIVEYKKHPYLYDNNLYQTNCRFSRAEGFTKIRTNVNKTFNTSFTNEEIRIKICHLRSSYRRILRAKEKFEKLHANTNRKFLPQWKYFDKLSFIGTKDSDFPKSRKKPLQKSQHEETDKTAADDEDEVEYEESRDGEDEGNTKNIVDNNDVDELMKVDPLEHHDDRMSGQSDDRELCEFDFKIEFLPENEEQPVPLEHLSVNGEDEVQNPKSTIKNKEIILAIIEEYQKLPCLWAVENYTYDNYLRREAFQQIAKNINDKFKAKYTYKHISNEIVKLRSSYKRMLKRKQKYPTQETKLWYAEKLSFIEGKASQQQNQENCNERNNSSPQLDEAEEDDVEEMFHRKNKVLSKDMVLRIIDLYKTAPILWDTNHPSYILRTERRKAIKKITEILASENECDLTVEDYRYHIRSLRESYFRALRHEKSTKTCEVANINTPKPFYFDRLSFLEPFAEKCPSFTQKWNEDIKEPSGDFTYLVENKPLMIEFIEVYKAHPCLWNSKNKDRDNLSVHSEAYDKIISTFLKFNLKLTKEQVVEATRFLHFSYAKLKKINEKNSSEPQLWFYDHLLFLTKVPKNTNKYCSHCDQNFHTLIAYEKHKIEIAGDYPYKCSVCNAGFVSRSKYAYHQITHKEPHKCEQCDFQAYDKHNFNVHMRRHKGIHHFKCVECYKGFVTSSELNRHMRMHTGERPFICDICGKSLTSNSEFRRHTKRHNNQRDHKCDLCGSAFFTPKTLRDHMASHSNVRQHVCETCGAAFKRKKTLHQHKALHAEKKKHECKICGKMFAQKAGVYSHMKSHGLMTGS